MHVLIATPLYPPDIAEPAPYVKELASRLTSTDAITIIAYGRLPETIPNVRIISVSKQRPLVLRLISYTYTVWDAMKVADIIYAQNGASVELPLFLLTLISRKPIVTAITDISAHQRARSNQRLRTIEKALLSRAKSVVQDIPLSKPEMLPFSPKPVEQIAAWNSSWQEHVTMLRNLFIHIISKPS